VPGEQTQQIKISVILQVAGMVVTKQMTKMAENTVQLIG